MNLQLTTLTGQSPLPHVGPGEPQVDVLCRRLESLEMKSTLNEARTRYSGPAKPAAPAGPTAPVVKAEQAELF